MATTRQRRASAAAPLYLEDAQDRVYTEEDYAVQTEDNGYADEWDADGNAYLGAAWTEDGVLPDEAFLPDEEEYPDTEWADIPDTDTDGYIPLFNHGNDYLDDTDTLLDDELLTDEERNELRRSHWKLLAGLADFAGVILGTVAILVLVMLLVSLLNWLINDVSQSFILLQKHL